MTSYEFVDGPAVEPVTLDELRRHCRVFVEDDGEDAYLAALGKAAREHLEAMTCRSFVTQTIEATLDGFTSACDRGHPRLRLLYPPLQSVTSITYVDPDGATQTMPPSDYVVRAGTPGVIAPAPGKSWPSTSGSPGAVVIQFVAGYGDSADDVPETAKIIIKWLVGQWYEQRRPITTGTIVAPTPYMLESLAASLQWGSYP